MSCKTSVLTAQWHCRFRRLAGGEDRLSLATLYEQPDLAGNAFVHRIFRLFDTDQDGFLTWQDFSAGIHEICGLSTEDDQSLCEQPASHLVPSSARKGWSISGSRVAATALSSWSCMLTNVLPSASSRLYRLCDDRTHPDASAFGCDVQTWHCQQADSTRIHLMLASSQYWASV